MNRNERSNGNQSTEDVVREKKNEAPFCRATKTTKQTKNRLNWYREQIYDFINTKHGTRTQHSRKNMRLLLNMVKAINNLFHGLCGEMGTQRFIFFYLFISFGLRLARDRHWRASVALRRRKNQMQTANFCHSSFVDRFLFARRKKNRIDRDTGHFAGSCGSGCCCISVAEMHLKCRFTLPFE